MIVLGVSLSYGYELNLSVPPVFSRIALPVLEVNSFWLPTAAIVAGLYTILYSIRSLHALYVKHIKASRSPFFY